MFDPKAEQTVKVSNRVGWKQIILVIKDYLTLSSLILWFV